MEVEKQLYEVKIAGLSLRLRSTHDKETVDKLFQIVQKKVDEAQAHGPQVSSQNALILAALHLAEELVLTKGSALSGLEQLEVRTRDILSDLESSPISQINPDHH